MDLGRVVGSTRVPRMEFPRGYEIPLLEEREEKEEEEDA